jgi:hypothetical protein
VVAAALILQRLFGAIRYATKNDGFRAIFGTAIFLILLGTGTYSVSQGWNVLDSFYFAVCTLTTSNVSDPHLTLSGEPIKIFTAFYVLIGIGVLVETVRQIGLGYVKMRSEHGVIAKHSMRHRDDSADTSSAD